MNNHYLIESFITHRKEIKSPFTAQALTMFKNKVEKLEKAGYDVKEMVNLAIESGWKTIYPPKSYSQANTYPQKARTNLGSVMDASNMRSPAQIQAFRKKTSEARKSGLDAIRGILK